MSRNGRFFILTLLVAAPLLPVVAGSGCKSGVPTFSQDTWVLSVGGSGEDEAVGLVALGLENLAVAGNTSSFGAGGGDAWIVGLGPHGQVLWERAVGGPSEEIVHAVSAAGDGIVLAGVTQSFGAGNEDAWVVRLDGTGAVAWQKTAGGGGRDFGYGVTQLPGGDLVLVGRTGSFGSGLDDALLARLSGSGEPRWTRSLDTGAFEAAYDVTERGGDLFVLADAGDPSNLDLLVVRLDADGNVLWSRTYGGSETEGGRRILAGPGGTFFIVGRTASFEAEGDDIWVLAIDGEGAILWQKVIGGSASDWAGSAAVTADGGLVIAGETWSFPESEADVRAFLLRLDGTGGVLWKKGLGVDADFKAAAVVEGGDGLIGMAGKVLLEGAGEFDMAVARLTAAGAIEAMCSQLDDLGLSVIDSDASPVDMPVTAADVDAAVGDAAATTEETEAEASYVCPE
jgi:hypothetical protein